MLKRIIDEKWLGANAVFGLFPANSVNSDDIEIYTDESRSQVAMTWHNLRQQMVKPEDKPNLSLGDFIAPKESGVADYIGAFAVTTGIGIDERVAEFESKHDDYNSIMLKALATVWPKPSPNCCMLVSDASSGAMPPTNRPALKI